MQRTGINKKEKFIMKKLLSTMIAMSTALAPLSVLSVTTAAGTDSSIEVSTVTAKKGDTVEVPVTLSANSGVVAVSFTVDYDKNALELLDVKDGALFKDASFTPGGDKAAVPYRLMWENALATENYTNTGDLAVLQFKVLDTAKDGLSEIKLDIEKDNTFDVDMDNVEFKTVNGGIQLGDVVTTPAVTSAVTTVKSTASTTTTTKATETTTKATETTTKAAETTTKGSSVTTTAATTTKATTESTTTTTATKATEASTTTTAATSAAKAADIEISSVTAKAGDEITVPVKLNNNKGIAAISFTINYDQSALTLTEVTDGALFKDASFTPSGDYKTVPFRVMWENALAKDNYTNTGDIAILKFKVAANAKDGAYPITIDIEKDNTFNVDMDNVEFSTASGSVKVGDVLTPAETTTSTTTTATTTSTTTTTKAAETTTKAAETTTKAAETTTKAAETTTKAAETTTKAAETTTKAAETTTKAAETTTTTKAAETTTKATEASTTTTKAEETTTSTKAAETTTEAATSEATTTVSEEVTTTSEAATTTAEAEEVTTTTQKEIKKVFSDEDLKEMAINDYKQFTNKAIGGAKTSHNDDGTVSIAIEDADGKVVETYTVFPESGKGTTSNGQAVDLPQTGNNSVKNVAAAAVAMAFTLTGAYAMTKSGVLRKKRDEE